MSNISLAVPDLGDKFVDDRLRVAGDSFTWDFPRTTTQVKYIAVHHSVTSQTGTWQEQVDFIAKIHTDPPPQGRGWSGIGYHFVICSDGTVAYVGDLGMARANVSGKNDQVIGVCLVGDFTKILPTDAQITSAHKLIKVLINPSVWPNIKGWEQVVGHQELDATACPGSIWKGPGDSIYERIKNNIPYTPPTTTVTTTITTLTSSSSSTTTITPPPVTTPPPLPAGEVLRKVADVVTGKGFWWTKYGKIKTIIYANKHLWES